MVQIEKDPKLIIEENSIRWGVSSSISQYQMLAAQEEYSIERQRGSSDMSQGQFGSSTEQHLHPQLSPSTIRAINELSRPHQINPQDSNPTQS